MIKKATLIFKPYSALLFLDNKIAGAILFALTFLIPSVGISGIFAVFITIIFAEFITLREEVLENGFYLYNSLLVGMGIGYIFSPTLLSFFLILILSSFTFLLSFVLYRIFSVYKIPILSLPFSIITMIAYLASLKYSYLYSNLINSHNTFDIHIYSLLDPFFRSIGTIFFLPNVLAGLVISLIILYFSRIIFFMGIISFYLGIFIHSLLLSNFTQALNDPYAFNYILVGIALGGIFLLPTLKNYILAFLGVIMSVVIVDAMDVFFNYYAIPVFTIPFNIIVMMFIFVLSSIYYKEFNYNIKKTPEKSLSYYLSNIFRFGKDIKIALPFSGEWSVYQAFNGEWTHKGKWKYAYDFVIENDDKTHKNEGLYVSDYYCFGQSVLSPVNGYVVALRNDLVDNIIGEVDRINNWGNYIIIKNDAGYFIEISHLMQNSISVNVGDYIHQGQIIAKCGNSGYSPEPHIHIQLQKFAILGSETIPFVFSEYLKENKLFYNSLPKKDEKIKSLIIDKSMQLRFNFILDDIYRFVNEKNEKIEFKVDMNSLGEFYFKDKNNNKLYFYSTASLFYFYNYEGEESYLKEIFKLAPKIPFINAKNIEYSDVLPVYLLNDKIKSALIEFIASFKPSIYKKEFSYNFNSLILSSQFGNVTLESYKKGFQIIKTKEFTLRRID
jgi:urea transporter